MYAFAATTNDVCCKSCGFCRATRSTDESLSTDGDVRLRTAYVALIRSIGALCAQHFEISDIPVVVHGYDYPVPDGRGF